MSGNGLLQFPDGFILALGDQLSHAGRETKQFEQGFDSREIPVFGLFDVFERGEFVHSGPCQLRQVGSVELLTRSGKDGSTGVDQCGQNDHHPFRFQALAVLVHILHTLVVVNQFGTIDYLAMTLFLKQPEDVPGVFRFVRFETLPIEQFQGIENRRGLPGTLLTGNGAQGVLRGLVPVVTGDEHRKGRIFRRLILEMGSQTNAGDGIDHIAEVDALMRVDAGQLPDRLALGPIGERSGSPLVGDFEGIGHALLQPLQQVPQKKGCLGLIGGAGMSRRRGGQVQSRSVVPECRTEFIVHVDEPQIHFVRLLLILEVRRIEGLDEIKVKIPRGNGSRTFVGRTEKEISLTRGLALQPLQLVFPDLVTGDVGPVRTLHDPFQGLVVITIELRSIQALCPFFDQRVEVVGLFQVEVELPVVGVRGDELPADRPVDLTQDSLYVGEQVVEGTPPNSSMPG